MGVGWAWDEKRGALCRKEGDGIESTREEEKIEKGIREDGWTVSGMIKERRECRGRSVRPSCPATYIFILYRPNIKPIINRDFRYRKSVEENRHKYLARAVSQG